MMLKLCLNLVLSVKGTPRKWSASDGLDVIAGTRLVVEHLVDFFGNPVTERQRIGDCYLIRFDRPLVCFNAHHLHRELKQIPSGVADVILHFGERVSLIDHTTCEYLLDFVEEHRRSVSWVELVGMERLVQSSPAETSMRLAPSRLTSVPAPAV